MESDVADTRIMHFVQSTGSGFFFFGYLYHKLYTDSADMTEMTTPYSCPHFRIEYSSHFFLKDLQGCNLSEFDID